MKEYFECNLPDDAEHMEPNSKLRSRYKEVAKKIHERTEKLNAALAATKMTGDEFQPYAAELFKNHSQRFDSMTAQDIAAYVNMVADGRPYISRLDWPNATVLFDTSFATNEEWVTVRHIGLGGSNTEVSGVNTHTIPRYTYYDKRGIELKAPEKKSTIPLERGHFVEDNIIAKYCELTGAVRIPETRMFASKKYPHCIADVDGIVQTHSGEIKVFEAKSTIVSNTLAWTEGKVPQAYIEQSHHYPGVLNDDRITGTVISCMMVQDYGVGDSFFGIAACGDNITQFIDRDKDVEERLMKLKEDFWTNHIAKGVLPEDSGIVELETKLLNELNGYDESLGPTKWELSQYEEILEEYFDADTDYKKAQSEAEYKKAIRDQKQQKFIAALGAAPMAYMKDDTADSVYVIKYMETKPKETVDLNQLKIYFRDAYDACVSISSGSRRFYLSRKSQAAFNKDMKKMNFAV